MRTTQTKQLSESDLINSIRKQSIMGNRKLTAPIVMTLPKKTMKKLKDSNISTEEFLAMLVYAKHLPRGKRELKLNFKQLREQLISEVQEDKAYLTQMSGLRLGGKVAITTSTKPLSQLQHIYNIKNKNRNQTNPIPFVPYPYFKNSFKL